MSVLTYLQSAAEQLTLNEPERERMSQMVTRVQANLAAHFSSGIIRKQFCFGSWARRTALPRRIDPESDIDYMIVFDRTSRVRPQALMDRLRGFAEECFPRSETHQSRPTVVLSLNRYRLELVPAYDHWFWGLQIPARTSDYLDWTSTDPATVETELNRKDADHGRHIRSIVRLLKYWNVVNNYVFDSFAIERAVIDHSFSWVASNLQARLFSVIDGLPTSGLSKAKRASVEEAREIVNRVEHLQANEFPEYAEIEVTRLIPEIKLRPSRC